MSAANQAFVTPQVLRWARERARVKQDKVAERLHAPLASVAAWELGKAIPTLHQAQQLAEVLHIPFGYLFLPSPPHEKIPLPDFRTAGDAQPEKPSAELIDLLNDVLFKQQWFREFLVEQGARALSFIGRFSIKDDSAQVAADIRQALQINSDMRQGCATSEEFLRAAIRNAEAAGILVMRSGIAAGDPHRPLSPKEFRGFAISDPIAPLIFINVRDWLAAQIFTLAHELVHVWIGASGISNENLAEPRLGDNRDVERFCNATAAETLVPRAEFLGAWNTARPDDDNIDIISHVFRVSTLVALRRAFDLDRISWKKYRERYEQEERKFNRTAERRGKGGNFYHITLARNSATLTGAVVQGALGGKVLYRDAARLLNVGVPAIQKIAKYLARPKEAK